MNMIAFLSYLLVTAITPGPNNIMAMTNAGKVGFKKGLRFNFGVLAGFLIVMSLCTAFTSLLYDSIPQIAPIMRVFGAGFMLWLAWTVWRDEPHQDKTHAVQANSLLSGMVLQFVNVKVILYGITGISTFVAPYYKGIIALMPFAILMSFIGFASTCLWALCGSFLAPVFHRHKRMMNVVFALLLIVCAVSQLIDI